MTQVLPYTAADLLRGIAAECSTPEEMQERLREIAADEVSGELIGDWSFWTLPGENQPWLKWVMEMWPHLFRLPGGLVEFAPFHHEMWEWVFGIGDNRPRPFLAVWPRDTGKSTHAEVCAAYLGLEGVRRYALYVCGTQSRADDHVSNIASLLESKVVERRYPGHAERMVGKYQQSKGWRVNRLRTQGGLTVDAIGLDKAVRGARLEESRPDLIILDDIDERHDSPFVVGKKVETITESIIPAGNRNKLAVLFVQNIIHDHSVMAKLVGGEANWLVDRIVSGPHPALQGLTYEDREADGVRRTVLTAGVPTWAGMSLDTCQRIVDASGLTAFRREYQQERGVGLGGLWQVGIIDHVETAPSLWRIVVGVDPQGRKTEAQRIKAQEVKETGIIVAGLDPTERQGWVLEDLSGNYSPNQWGKVVCDAFRRYNCMAVVAEVNYGGDMVQEIINNADPTVTVENVTAGPARGKVVRAEPVVALYERGQVHHVGTFPALESEMLTWKDEPGQPSPNRMDALVWALWRLLLSDPAQFSEWDPGRHVVRTGR